MIKLSAKWLILTSALFCATLSSHGENDPFAEFETVNRSHYVMVAAHRAGYISNGSAIHPENSLAALAYSLSLGVDILEIDVRLTSDLVPIIMHDSTVNRTTSGSGTVSDLTLAEIKELTLNGSDEKVSTLEEFMLAVKGKAMVNLDKVSITDTTQIDAIMPVLQRTDTVDHAIFKGGSSAEEVETARARYPDETIIYMTLLSNKTEEEMIASLQSHIPPATEIIFSSSLTEMLSSNSLATAIALDTHIWINSLWSSLCAGHTDAAALGGNPDGSWGWLIDKGATIIQTDNSEQLIAYLEGKGLRNNIAPPPPPAPLPPQIGFNFDDGTMQGWSNSVVGSTGSNPAYFSARVNQGKGGGHSLEYSLMHDGDGLWLDGRDNPHDTLVASSPEFGIDRAQAISFYLLGGTGSSSASPTSRSALPGATSSDGFMGMALRRVGDGAYILLDRTDSSGQDNAWEKQGWDASTVAAAIADDSGSESYQLDLIDQFHGSWGWIIMDSVSIEFPPYDQWTNQHLRVESSSKVEDADGDSAANLLEYFSGTDPIDPLSTPSPFIKVIGDRPIVQYQRAKNRPDAHGVLQWNAGSLETWYLSGESDGTRSITVYENTLSEVDEIETIEAFLQTTSGTSPQSLFVRLSVW